MKKINFMSNFSFCLNDFKSHLLRMLRKVSASVKGLIGGKMRYIPECSCNLSVADASTCVYKFLHSMLVLK